jgi:hypothetical protein
LKSDFPNSELVPRTSNFEPQIVLPAFIDCHTHICFVGEGIDHPGLLTKVIAIEKNENIDYKKILTLENNTPVELKIELENHSVPAFFYEFEHYIFIRLNKLFRIGPTIMETTAHLIANKNSFYAKKDLIFDLKDKLEKFL